MMLMASPRAVPAAGAAGVKAPGRTGTAAAAAEGRRETVRQQGGIAEVDGMKASDWVTAVVEME